MSSFISKFIKSFRQKGDCPEKQKCLEILNLVLDNEATEDQKEYFRNHIKECMPCNEGYSVEKSIRELLQSKCANKEVPADLVDSIKMKISETAN